MDSIKHKTECVKSSHRPRPGAVRQTAHAKTRKNSHARSCILRRKKTQNPCFFSTQAGSARRPADAWFHACNATSAPPHLNTAADLAPDSCSVTSDCGTTAPGTPLPPVSCRLTPVELSPANYAHQRLSPPLLARQMPPIRPTASDAPLTKQTPHATVTCGRGCSTSQAQEDDLWGPPPQAVAVTMAQSVAPRLVYFATHAPLTHPSTVQSNTPPFAEPPWHHQLSHTAVDTGTMLHTPPGLSLVLQHA